MLKTRSGYSQESVQTSGDSSQNCRAWLQKGESKRKLLSKGSERLRMQKVQRSPGIMVSLGVSLTTGISTPFFVEANTKTNSQSYVALLENHFGPFLSQFEEMQRHGVWQEDNAPSHTSKFTTAWKAQHWAYNTLAFPPHSPDLTVLDYSVWNSIEMQLRGKNMTIPELKLAVTRAIHELNTVKWEHVKKAIESFPSRLERCVLNGGGYIEG